MRCLFARLAAATLIAGFLAAPALAGITIEMTHRDAGDQDTTRARTFLEADRARMEVDGHLAIWRADKRVFWVVDEAEGVVHEIDESAVDAMAGMMAQMQAQMAAMPAEQRAMMEAMMKQRGGGAMTGAPARAPAPMTWTANGTSDTIAERACKGFDGKRDGQLVEVVCAADWSALGVSATDFSALESLGKFMAKMGGPMQAQAEEIRRGLIDPAGPGVPLRTTVTTPRGASVTELVSVTRSDLAAALFEPPAGLQRRKMTDAMGAGRHAAGRP